MTEVIIFFSLNFRNINNKIGKRGISCNAKLERAIICAPVRREHNISPPALKMWRDKGGLAMKDATLRQGKKVWDLIDDSGVDSQQLQNILPYFSILLKANTMEMNREEFRKSCRLRVSKLPEPKILEFCGTVTILATSKKFIAKKKFVINTGDGAIAKISKLGDSFSAEFLGKIEKPFGGSELWQQKLRQSSTDDLIIAEIGGKVKAETMLCEVFALIEKQSKGESGVLIDDGHSNIFYVYNTRGVLCAVCVYWYGDGWFVGARSIKGSRGWGDGDQVLFRNAA